MMRARLQLKYSLVLFLLYQGNLMAQGGEGGGFDQTQIITGDRTLTVQKAYKISETPVPVEIPVQMGELKYNLLPKRPIVQIDVEPIEPAKVKVREPLEKLYHGFIKAGAGSFANAYGEAFYTSGRDRDLAYGIHAKHFSANKSINRPVAYSGFSENLIEVWGKKIFKANRLEAKMAYDRRVNYFYGFNPQDADIDKQDIRQRFNDFSIESDWKSYYRDSSRINQNLGLDFYLLNDRFDAKEFGVKATADLRSYRGEQYYSLGLGFDLISYAADSLSRFPFMSDFDSASLPAKDLTNAIVNANPTILLTKNGFRALVGLALFGQFSSKADFHAFPNVEVSYALFNTIFVPYAGITGAVQRNSFRTLTRQNPFLLSNTSLINSVVKYDLFGGIRGSVSDHVSFNTRVAYKRTTNTPLYVNDTLVSIENRFAIIYDRINTFSILGELSYQGNEKWSATASGQIFSYTTDQEDEAWHLPAYRLSLSGSYNLFNKLRVGTEMALIGSRMVKSLLSVPDINSENSGYTKVTLNPYFDLSLSAEYQYTSRLAAFVEANNLTASRYDIYYRFPAQRVFVMGGLKFSF